MTSYTARIELAEPAPTPDRLDAIVDALTDYHPAASPSARRRIEVTITLPADNLGQATTTALAVVHHATALEPTSIAIATTDDYDTTLGLTPLPEMMSVTQAAARLDVTRQAILQRLDAGTLPGQRVGSTWAIPTDAVERAAQSS